MGLPQEFYDLLDEVESDYVKLGKAPNNEPRLLKARIIAGEGSVKVKAGKIKRLCFDKGESTYVVSSKLGKYKEWLYISLKRGDMKWKEIKMLADYFDVDIERLIA